MLAIGSGAIFCSACRGDIEILLSAGADSKNDLGHDTAAIIQGPELKGILQKRERINLRGTGKKTRIVEARQKNQYGNPIQHELYDFFGDDDEENTWGGMDVIEVHQKLRDKFLTPWHSAPTGLKLSL